MATSYYLINKKKNKEYKDFQKFWEEELIPDFTKRLWDYCGKYDGDYVNNDFAEDVEDSTLYKIMNLSIYDDWNTYERIGQLSYVSKRFNFDRIYCEEIRIFDLDSLKKALDEYPQYGIINEEGEEISFEKLKEIIDDVK